MKLPISTAFTNGSVTLLGIYFLMAHLLGRPQLFAQLHYFRNVLQTLLPIAARANQMLPIRDEERRILAEKLTSRVNNTRFEFMQR